MLRHMVSRSAKRCAHHCASRASNQHVVCISIPELILIVHLGVGKVLHLHSRHLFTGGVEGPLTAQHSTAQHSIAQHSTAQHSTAQHSTAQHSTAHTARQGRAWHNTVAALHTSSIMIHGSLARVTVTPGSTTVVHWSGRPVHVSLSATASGLHEPSRPSDGFTDAGSFPSTQVRAETQYALAVPLWAAA